MCQTFHQTFPTSSRGPRLSIAMIILRVQSNPLRGTRKAVPFDTMPTLTPAQNEPAGA